MVWKRLMVLLGVAFVVALSGSAARAQTDETTVPIGVENPGPIETTSGSELAIPSGVDPATYCIEHGGWWIKPLGICEIQGGE